MLTGLFQVSFLFINDPNLYFEVAFWSQQVKLIQINKAWCIFGRSELPTPPLTIGWWGQVINSLFSLYFSFIFNQPFKGSLLVKITSNDIIRLYIKKEMSGKGKYFGYSTSPSIRHVLQMHFLSLVGFFFFLFVRQLTVSDLSLVPKCSSELVGV